jgi:DNA polymerase-1
METVLLIDGDLLAFRFAFRNTQVYDWGDGTSECCDLPTAKAETAGMIETYTDTLDASRSIIVLSSFKNFRKVINPKYKVARKKNQIPKLVNELRKYLIETYEVEMWESLEADDTLGILSTWDGLPGRKIIVSNDKDMGTVPGLWYKPNKDELYEVSETEADFTFYRQVLTGDTTDGYFGVPGIGPKKATKILSKVEDGDYWSAVVATYEAAGLTKADALMNARMARILRCQDYDFERRQVKLWTPPQRGTKESVNTAST